ncbi:hypothetical protein [Arcobacter sp. FWKO B]|uniref:hypothetical protein n=1 Tax=Arcobacter sp. FWKO B TaxID=2593672 RepID=UPI0018A44B2A|nr:hypothetical protein [Arcobacter sp. FWKO B]QOG11622.1 hypothetical protein FWKOB_02420 [Arcobacter sp. FWKO B]
MTKYRLIKSFFVSGTFGITVLTICIALLFINNLFLELKLEKLENENSLVLQQIHTLSDADALNTNIEKLIIQNKNMFLTKALANKKIIEHFDNIKLRYPVELKYIDLNKDDFLMVDFIYHEIPTTIKQLEDILTTLLPSNDMCFSVKKFILLKDKITVQILVNIPYIDKTQIRNK